jgi:hypothetical protein
MASSAQALAAWMANNRGKVFRYIYVLQIVTGLIFLFLGYFTGKDHFILIRRGVRAPGIVVDYKAEIFRDSSRNSTSTGYMPIVQFQAGERIVRFEDWMGSRIAESLRRPVTVLYNPTNPSNAMIDRPIMNWIPWAPTFALGLFLFLVGLRGCARPVVQA